MSRAEYHTDLSQEIRIGFDLGGTKMLATVYDSGGRLLAEEKTESRGYDGMDKGLARMVRLTKKVIRAAGVSADQVGAVGIACPAVIDLEQGMMVYAPNLGWKNVPVADVFRNEYPGSKISVLNDVDAGTYGEYAEGAGRGARTVLGIFAGTGLGSGCVYDGKLVRGKRFSCMEIGNLRLPGPSLFGSVHSPPRVEEIVSRLGLAGAAAVAAYRGDAPTILRHAKSDLRKIKADTLAAAVKAGDPAIVQALENSVFYLAVAVAAAVDLLGPDRIVLGGGLVEQMPQHFCNGLKHHLKQLACPGIADDIQVTVASLGDYAVPLGAAAHAAAMTD
jgi:glucokinase